VIETRELVKDFRTGRHRTVHAVRGISLHIEPGELVAVLGHGPAALPELLRAAVELPVATAQVHRPTLDDVFLGLTGRSLREAEAVRSCAPVWKCSG